MSETESQFWNTYHRLLDWVDDDGLPDPDKHDAAHWMNEMYSAIRECAITPCASKRIGRAAMDAVNSNRPAIFPLR